MDTAHPGRRQTSHERILDTAAATLRGGGFHGIGVADVMKRSGLTHGGFYAHFPSREALLAEALERAGQDSCVRLRSAIEAGQRKGHSPLRALVDHYLSEAHLRTPEAGCPVAALASEMPRQGPGVQQAAAEGVAALVRIVQGTLPAGQSSATASVIASQLVGTLQLARALGDNTAGRRHLAATRRFLLEQFDSPRQPSR